MMEFIKLKFCEILGGHTPNPGVVCEGRVFRGVCQSCHNKIISVGLAHWERDISHTSHSGSGQ